MSDTLGYQPPGVYVTQESNGVLTATSPAVPNTVALVGPTLGYFTNTDTLTLSQTTPVALSQQGISLNSVTVNNAAGTPAGVVNVDYTLAQTGSGPTAITTIELTSGSQITSGTQVVYVSYNYTDSNYFLPHRFTSFNAIQAAYGPGYSSGGTLISPLTFAAQCLFSNGSPNVVVQPTTDTGAVATRSGLSAAYQQLQALTDVYFIVPIAAGITGSPGSSTNVLGVATDLASYVSSLLQYNQFAMGLYAPEYTSTVAPASIASVNNERLVTFYPNSLLASNPLTGATISVGGYNLAAACAGFLAGSSVQQGLTQQNIQGFTGIPTSIGVGLNAGVLNTIASAGVSLFVPNPSTKSFIIRHGLTTNMTSASTSEISVVRSIDYLIYDIATTLTNSHIIGSASTPQTAASIQSLVQSVLEANVTSGAILAYTGLSCSLSSTLPTTATVSFSAAPAYPINFIDVNFQVNSNGLSLSTSTS